MEFVESIFLASFSRKQGQLLCARGKKQQTADWRNKVCIISCSSAVVDNLHNLKSSYFLQMTISQKSHRGYSRVSVQGVESLWGDCRFIPADWGS